MVVVKVREISGSSVGFNFISIDPDKRSASAVDVRMVVFLAWYPVCSELHARLAVVVLEYAVRVGTADYGAAAVVAQRISGRSYDSVPCYAVGDVYVRRVHLADQSACTGNVAGSDVA